jgi:type IV pilus assembly protein PilQ
MKIPRGILLLGLFAAAGAAVATCVGLSDTSTAEQDQRPPAPQLAVRVVADPERFSDNCLRPEPATPELCPLPPTPVTPPGPVVAAVNPLQAQQFVPADEKSRIEQAYEFLRRELGRVQGQAEAVPPPPGAPSETSAAPSAPPAKEVSAAGAAPAGRTVSPPKADQSAPKAVVDSEGDGKLSIHIQNSELREVLNLLSEEGNLNILSGTSVQGKVSATLTGVDIDSALDAILKSTGFIARREGKFIFVGTPDEFNKLEESMDKIGTRVYRPNYVTAVDLQKLIQPMLSEKVGVVSVSTPSEAGIGADANKAGGNTFAGGDVVLVRDYENVLAAIDQMVAEVDVRPLQVYIEAMILSVQLKDSNRYGVNFELLRDKAHLKIGWGTPPNSLGDIKFENGALKLAFLDGTLGAFLNALESIGDTNVIATPRLMVLNKQRAEIQIGEQKGYVSTTVTETASTQAVQFLDIGALLRLRPFISTDGLIRMEIHPELSDGSVKTESGFTLPEKQVTQVTTNIMVRDGCTVVIGGLTRENLATTTAQVPLLGNLPLVGFLFRSSTETTERHEVLVLITPHIVYEPGTCQEGEQAACEFHRRQSLYADKMTPFNKRSMGRRYFRLAQSAWAAGDRDTALRFAELAVHFDPLSRAAIDLRSDIWLGKPCGEHALLAAVPGRPLASPLDDEHLADWLLQDLEREPTGQPAPLHPRDPGQPGRQKDIVRPRRLQ